MPLFGSKHPPVPLAIVGCAHIHTPNFVKRLQARQDVRVVAVWDHDTTRARRTAEALGAQTYGLDAIWRDATIRAAIICSETDRHPELVAAAAGAGKDLFVEKPLGIAGRDAWAMAEAVERAGVRFQTGYFMRGQPINLFLREQIRRGSFGTITRVRLTNCHNGALRGLFDTDWRWMTDPAVAGFGGFGDLGSHALDLLLWLLGDGATVTEVTARTGNATQRYGDCDEYGEGMLRFADGPIATIAAGWVSPASPITHEISGTGGSAVVVNGELYLQSERVAGADGKRPWRDLPEMQPHAFELFLDALVGQDVPLIGVREAARSSAVMEALYAAARHGGWERMVQNG
jgi:predicted dehydrogenase